jgi:hypothetical protein
MPFLWRADSRRVDRLMPPSYWRRNTGILAPAGPREKFFQKSKKEQLTVKNILIHFLQYRRLHDSSTLSRPYAGVRLVKVAPSSQSRGEGA